MPSSTTSLGLLLSATVVLLGRASSVSADTNNIIWSSTGGGWRAMTASSAYAQVFANIGLLGSRSNSNSTATIDTVATTSGSSWWAAQFFFSSEYYNAIVDGTPTSLGELTRKWFEAYASTQDVDMTNPASCGPLEDICSNLPLDSSSEISSKLSELRIFMSVANKYDFSWPKVMYAMFEETSKTFDDSPNMVNVRASPEDKIPELHGIDLCFHTTMMPNTRAQDTETITYLAQGENSNVSSSYSVPLPYDWCVGQSTAEWNHPLPGGNVFPAPDQFDEFVAQSGFPAFPPQPSDGLFTTLQEGYAEPLYPIDMASPFGGTPTAVQISSASSAALAQISTNAPSMFSSYMSLFQYGIDASNATESQKQKLSGTVAKLEQVFWDTYLFGNGAVSSSWTHPDPSSMPDAQEDSYVFGDGGYTDGPSVAGAIAQHQQKLGTDGKIKLILSNNNNIIDNRNNILGYFSTTWNQGVDPGSFVWPMGVTHGPQANPQQSKQIFEEYMDDESLDAITEIVDGTNITVATFSGTTVNNDAFGVVGGQPVSVLLINLNSDIPTLLITKTVIDQYTPKLVDMVEKIASSEDLAARVSAFVDDDETTSQTSAQTVTSGNFLRGRSAPLSIS